MQKWLYHRISVSSSLINRIFAFRLVKITKTGCGNMDQDVAVREEDLLFTLEGGIGRIIFNRPQARNAFTFAMYERLAEICTRANTDRAIKVLLLRGAGDKAFAAGAHNKQFPPFHKPQNPPHHENPLAPPPANPPHIPAPPPPPPTSPLPPRRP